MEDEAKQQPPPQNKKQSIPREEVRFNIIRTALPPHLRPGDVPEPLTNLSTAQNEHLARLHTLAEEGRSPSDALANAYFIDAMTKILGDDTSEYLSHNFIRLSKDKKYGYVSGAGGFNERQASPNPRPFTLFTLSTTEDGRCLHGKYTWIDVALPPLTKDHDHQYRVMPTAIKQAHENGDIPCRGIVFHSFDDDLRNVVRQSACLPEQHKGVASSVPSDALVPGSQYAYNHEGIGAIIDQARVFRQQSDEGFGALGSTQSEGREETSDSREFPLASPRLAQQALPASNIISQGDSNTPHRGLSRKGKEKATDVEEERSEANDVAGKSDAETEVQVQYDRSYAAQLAIAEARTCGLSQELLAAIGRNGGFRAKTQDGPDDTASTTPGGSGIHQRVRSEGDVVGESDLEPEEVEKRGSSVVDPPRHDHRFAATSSRSSAISPGDDNISGDRSPKTPEASLAGSEQRSTSPNGRDIDGGTSFGDGERRNGDTGLGNNGPTTPAPGSGEKRKRTTTSNGNADHPASKYPRPGSEINGSSFPSPLLPDRKASEDLPPASGSRKGKERAQDPEEPTKEVANIAKERVDAKLRVKYDSSHASELALDEARQSGLSQKQLEAMATFCDPIRAAAEGDGAENPAGSSANVASPEQASSSALAQSQPPTDDGLRSIDDTQPSPPSREASPARTETDSNIPYDDGVHDDEQDMGGTMAGQDPEQSGPTTPLPASGDKRKREPSSGSSERPATKHPRPGFQSEDESSPVPQSRLRSSRHDITLSLSRPVNGDGSNSEDRVTVSRTRFESLRSTNSIPEEETTPVAGGSSGLALGTSNSSGRAPSNTVSTHLGLQARNPAGGTKDNARELHTESQMGYNPTTPSQTPIRVATKPHRGLATGVQRAQESRGISASARPSPLSTMTTPAEGTPASPTAKGPAPRLSTNLLSETREDGTCGSKPAYHVRITGTSAAEGSRPTVPGSPTEPSTIPAAVPNETTMVQRQANGISRSDQTATSERHSSESSRSGTTSNHAIDILGLLRGWRAVFINLDAGLLAEAGLRVTQPGTASNQGVRAEQPVQDTPNQQAHTNRDYQSLLLGVLNTSRGVLSTVSPETLSTVGLEIIPWSTPSAVLPSSSPLRGGSNSDSQEEQGQSRTPSSASNSGPPNVEQFFAYLRDLMNSRSSMAPTPAPPTQPTGPHMTGLNGVAVSGRTSQVNHDPGSRGMARRTQDTAVETDESALPTNQAEVQPTNGLSSQVTGRHENPPASGLDITKTKTKPKTKNRKNKEKLDTDATNVGPDETATTDALEDSEMTVLEPHPDTPGSTTNNPSPSVPRVNVSSGATHARSPTPMDTEWDDKKCDPEDREVKMDRSPPRSNGDDEAPSGSSTRKQERHREGPKIPEQPLSTATPSGNEGNVKQPPKKKGSKRGTKVNSDPVRPEEPSPAVEDHPGPSRTGPTVTEPSAVIPARTTPSPIGRTATTPPATSAIERPDESMVDVESPRRLPDGELRHGSQTPTPETFGEGPIVPDDEEPLPFSSSLDTSIAAHNNTIPDPNLQPSQNPTPGNGPAETAVDNAMTNIPGDSRSESDLTEEYEESRANPFRLRDAAHAAAAQEIMNELLPPSRRSPQPSHPVIPPTEPNVDPAPPEQPRAVSVTPVQSGSSGIPNPTTGSSIEDQVDSGMPLRPEQSYTAGPSDPDRNGAHPREEQQGEPESPSSPRDPIRELVTAFGVWSLFFERPSSPS